MFNLILITRPEKAAAKTTQAIKDMGLIPFIEPMLTMTSIPHDMPNMTEYDSLIITSAAVFEFIDIAALSLLKPVLCVGEETRTMLVHTNFKNVIAFPTAQKINNALDPDHRYLYISGKDVHQIFNPKICDRVIVYDALKTNTLSAACIDLFNQNRIRLVTLYSQRSAEAFITCMHHNNLSEALSHCDLLCISKNVLKYADKSLWKNTYTARTPDHNGMMQTIKDITS